MKLWYKKAAWSKKRARDLLAEMAPGSVQSIAVIRHAALGDMIHTRPFLLELKRAFPNAKITLSIISSYKRGTPEDLVDRIHVVHRSSSMKQGILEQVRTVKALGYHDFIFDLSDTPRSRMIAALNSAKLKVGFTSYRIVRNLVFDISLCRSELVFEADMNLQLLNIFGVKTSYPPIYRLASRAHQGEEKFVVYFPSASVPERRWQEDRVVGLIRKMANQFNIYTHYVLEGIGDQEETDSILSRLQEYGNVLSIQKNSLEETIAFIDQASLVVSNDTSIRHLAIAVATPSVGIYFSADLESTPFRYWPRWGFHEAAFEVDGSQPTVENVFDCCSRLLKIESNKESV